METELIKTFLRVARRKKRERQEKLMDEFERLAELDGEPLLRSEVLEFTVTDPDFKYAKRAAGLLLGGRDVELISFVQFRPESTMPAFRVYVVFDKEAASMQYLTGKEKRVSDRELCVAWQTALSAS